jgi:hypothetical protein
MENKPEIEVAIQETIERYESFNNTKSKIRRSEEGKKLDKAMKKLKKLLDNDERKYYT